MDEDPCCGENFPAHGSPLLAHKCPIELTGNEFDPHLATPIGLPKEVGLRASSRARVNTCGSLTWTRLLGPPAAWTCSLSTWNWVLS